MQESQQKKAVSLEPQEGIKDTTKQTQKTENMNLCRASCWGVALRIRLDLPPPRSHCSSHPVLVPGKCWPCGDGGGQPVSPARVPSPERPLSRRPLARRLPDGTAVALLPRLWPGVPAQRQRRGGIAAAGDRRATNTRTASASSRHRPRRGDLRSLPAPRPSTATGLSSASLFKTRRLSPRPSLG